ncbi:peritrophin-44 [Eurosta solidaginis]|uniref:peritrophin-44 n=1 Tax=Eurosta solidaginis TaxID=178769 RepID=UPI003531526C
MSRLSFLLALKFVISVCGDIYEECNGKPSHAFITSNTSCSHYIYCSDNESYEGQCPDGDYFNELLQTCDPKELVDCKLKNSTGIDTNSPFNMQTPTMSPTMSSLLPITSEITTMDFNTATAYNSLIESTTMASMNTYAPSTTTAPLTNNETSIIVSSGCPVTDNPSQMIFVPNPKSCSNYFICYHGDKLTIHCSSSLHFNVKTGKCDYPENVRCQADFTNPKQQCQSHIIDLFPHATNCNYFYSCRNGYLLLQQCPFGFGWDFEKRACTLMQQAICYNKKINRTKN